jgi:hypothetical protein
MVLRSNLLISFPSQILDSAICPTRVDLFLQKDDSAGQPLGGCANSYQALLFQGVNLVGQSSDMMGVLQEWALHSKSLGIQGVGQQRKGG